MSTRGGLRDWSICLNAPDSVPTMNSDATAALLRVCRAALHGAPVDELTVATLAELRKVTMCDDAAFYDRPPDDPFLARIAREGVTTVESRVGDPAHHEIAVAVRTGAHSHGVLTIGSWEAEFGPSDREFLRELADVLSVAHRSERRRQAADVLFRRSRAVFDYNPGAKMLVDTATGLFVDVNHTAIVKYGYTRGQFLTMRPADLLEPGELDPFEGVGGADQDVATTFDAVHRRADGSRLDAHVTCISMHRDDDDIYVMTVQDMTERNDALARALKSETQLAHDSVHDRLTGLPNRWFLGEHLTAEISRARREHRKAAVLFIDIDCFKDVNDTMGHAAGDVLLREVAHRLRSATRRSDCIARTGGDEFVGVISNIADNELINLVRKLERVIAAPIRVPAGEINVTCSIGVALFPRDGEDPETLISNADSAMYRAKREGRAATRFFASNVASAMTTASAGLMTNSTPTFRSKRRSARSER
jgi:diguanylate cyclase (GGDEF)-like protein/PAS domain S-box-containing protein